MPTNTIYLRCDADVVRFNSFYFSYNRALFIMVLNDVVRYRDYNLTKDICQQVWLEIWVGVANGTYNFLNPGLFLLKALSRATDYYRRESRFCAFDAALHDRGCQPDVSVDVDWGTLMRTLPEKEAVALKMAFLDGVSQTAIAAELKIAERTVRRRLKTGIKLLRASVNRSPCPSRTASCQKHAAAK